MMQNKNLFIISLFLVSLLFSCRKDNELSPSERIKINIAGIVTDEDNKAIANAEVIAYGKTVKTNHLGCFWLPKVAVPADRAFIKVNARTYLSSFKAFIPGSSRTANLKVVLSRGSLSIIDAATGGTATLTNGASVSLPSSAVLSPNGYSNYSGQISVTLKHLDPEHNNFSILMPGDLEAIRTDGSRASLYSYGMLTVELKDQQGNLLKFAPGKKATLTFPVPSAMRGNAPAEIPLWYFDENVGIWREEGSAFLDQAGINYIGEVSHFSTWNCDVPHERCTIRGKVLDCNGDPMANVTVIAGQRVTFTDAEGNYSCFVPDGVSFEVTVLGEDIGLTCMPLSVGPFVAQETYTLPDLIVSCPAYISGSILTCDNIPGYGLAVASWQNGARIVVSRQDGTFKIPVPENHQVGVYVFTDNGYESLPVSITSGSNGSVTQAGTVTACSLPEKSVISFTVTGGDYENRKFIFAESDLIQGYYNPFFERTHIEGYNPQMKDTAYVLYYIAITFPGNSVGNFTDGGIIFLMGGGTGQPSSCIINVIRYDPPGGMIEGIFSGTTITNGIAYNITSGYFKVRRKD